MPSILTSGPSSTLAQSLVLRGRTLDVVPAVTRDEAGGKAREKGWNMYLLQGGTFYWILFLLYHLFGDSTPTAVILPNSPGAQTLTLLEIGRHTTPSNAQRALLKSKRSLFISKTRLSIRQTPIFVTEGMIKWLAIHALREFEGEVKMMDKVAGRRGKR